MDLHQLMAKRLATEQAGLRRSYLDGMTYLKASQVGVAATPGSTEQLFRVGGAT